MSPNGARVAIGVDDGSQASVQVYALNGTSTVRRLTLEGNDRRGLYPELLARAGLRLEERLGITVEGRRGIALEEQAALHAR